MEKKILTYEEMLEILKNFRAEVEEKIRNNGKKNKLIVNMYEATKISDIKSLKEFYGRLGDIINAVQEATEEEVTFDKKTIKRLKVIFKYFQDTEKNLEVLNKYEKVTLEPSTYFDEQKDIMKPLQMMVSVFDREPFGYNLEQIMKAAGWYDPPIVDNIVNEEKDGIYLKDSDIMEIRGVVVKVHLLGKVCKCYINKKVESYQKAVDESIEISGILVNLEKNIGDNFSDDSDKIYKCSNDIKNLEKVLGKFTKHHFGRYFVDKIKCEEFKKNLSNIKFFCKELSKKVAKSKD